VYYKELEAEAAYLRTLLLLFAFQHVIFIAARAAFWLFISIFCLGCACVEGDVVPMPRPDGISDEDFDPLGNQVVSFYYEKFIEGDRSLDGRGTLAEQHAQERALNQLRRAPSFLAASAAARPGQVGQLSSSIRERVQSLRVLGGQQPE